MLTAPRDSSFLLAPESPLQRQYEALPAFFVEPLPAVEVARRLGYTPGCFRVLGHQLRHDPDFHARFVSRIPQEPALAPVRDPLRDLGVAMGKRNRSVDEMQRELAGAGHPVSIHPRTLRLRQEGFAHRPRRLDQERPQALRPKPAAVAEVPTRSWAPRSFRTRAGGLFLVRPGMRDIRRGAVVRPVGLPGAARIPAAPAVRSRLARKLLGSERQSPVLDLVCDQGIALLAGLNPVPKRCSRAASSSRIDHPMGRRWLEVGWAAVPRAGRPRGWSFDLDCHAVPAKTPEEPREQHSISQRSRSQHGVLTFLAREASHRVRCSAPAGIPKADQAHAIQRFVGFGHKPTAKDPAELVFDSPLTTSANRRWLHQRTIPCLTLRRRSRPRWGAIFSRPASAWHRITLPSLTRRLRTPRVLDQKGRRKDDAGPLPQSTISDLGHEEPTIRLTNTFKSGCPTLLTR